MPFSPSPDDSKPLTVGVTFTLLSLIPKRRSSSKAPKSDSSTGLGRHAKTRALNDSGSKPEHDGLAHFISRRKARRTPCRRGNAGALLLQARPTQPGHLDKPRLGQHLGFERLVFLVVDDS